MERKSILYVGYSGFPFGLAQVERQKQISRGLINAGCNVTVICRKGEHQIGQDVQASGYFESIQYIYTSGSPFRPDSFLIRNWEKLRGLFSEAAFIRHKKAHNKADALLVTTLKFSDVLWYKIVGKLFGIPIIIDTVEFNASMDIKKGFMKRTDEEMYDKFSPAFADKVIVISDFLFEMVHDRYKAKPMLKIPAIVDFSKFDCPVITSTKYFLYCASANYLEIIAFVINSFEQASVGDIYLFLVCNGSEDQMNKLRHLISQSSKSMLIKLYTALPYQELVAMYMNSYALLIPLRNTPQDVARFPHKLGEYCASARAIITTNFGEVKSYFKDRENAYVADVYSVASFSDKLEEACLNAELTREIGLKGYQTGKENFDNMVLGRKIAEFIFNGENVLNNQVK